MNLNELKSENVKITIAGAEVEVKRNDPVKDTLTRILQEKGIDSFTILVDGEEVTSTSDLPAIFDGHEIEVERYVKAG
jgi:aerobic-type carbon monoxide dehydrogenase small subunit (CoxS/CutS family)